MHKWTVNASSIESQLHSRSISGRNQNIDEAQVVLCWLSGRWAVAGNEKAAKCCASDRASPCITVHRAPL
jgi:hypothetical protein